MVYIDGRLPVAFHCLWTVLVLKVNLVYGETLPLINLVSTTHGYVQGTRAGDTDVFWGIPYAHPPVGRWRWRSPQPREPWAPEIIEAKTKPPGCIQICEDVSYACPSTTSEDCLYLNVYRPSRPRTSGLLPVMVYLHGGNYRSGSCSGIAYDGHILAPAIDAIVVCIDYRLGALGFLYLEEDPETGEKIDGNFGLQDQIAALKFLRDNLESFGGDSTRVTLSGQSAGAESILQFLLSPEHSGLFDQTILFSGPFSLPLKTPTDSNALGLYFAAAVGCPTASLTCLRTRSTDDIATASHESLATLINNHKAFQLFQQWGPTVDEQPMSQFGEAGTNASLKPTMVGTLSEEGRIFVYELFQDPIPIALYKMYQSILVPGLSEDLLRYFPGDPTKSDQRDAMSDLITDYLFTCPAQRLAQLITGRGESMVYSYLFDHAWSARLIWQQFTWCEGHVCHGGDVPFIFLTAPLANISYSEEEIEFNGKLSTYLANFIHNGDPNHAFRGGRGNLDLPHWPKSGEAEGHFSTLVLSTEGGIRSKQDINREKCQFFDRFGYSGVPNIN